MPMTLTPPFDPKMLLSKVGDGRSIGKYRKNQVVFSQGELADAVFGRQLAVPGQDMDQDIEVRAGVRVDGAHHEWDVV